MARKINSDKGSGRVSGLWWYLISRVWARTRVELEEERNRATASVIENLRGGGVVEEWEFDGRYRKIQMPATPPPAPTIEIVRHMTAPNEGGFNPTQIDRGHDDGPAGELTR
jgi:hypothetical protein